MNRATVVRFPVFSGFEVRVILSHNLITTGRRLQTDLAGCAGAFLTSNKKPGIGWLVLPLDADEATVAHEASHAIRALLNHVGARNDNETFAYHLDFLVGRIHRFMKGKK